MVVKPGPARLALRFKFRVLHCSSSSRPSIGFCQLSQQAALAASGLPTTAVNDMLLQASTQLRSGAILSGLKKEHVADRAELYEESIVSTRDCETSLIQTADVKHFEL